MPFREKAKNLFRTKTRGDSLSTTSTNESNHDVYQPGETMPPPKYRRPPQKEHKDKLEAFSFADAWRKRSFQSSHSPGGTRASSRRASFLSTGRKSRKSMTSPYDDAEHRLAEQQAEAGASRPKDSGVEAPALKLPNGAEQEGDDNIAKAETKQTNGAPNGLHKVTTAKDHVPFSEDDFANAMKRSHMEVSAQS